MTRDAAADLAIRYRDAMDFHKKEADRLKETVEVRQVWTGVRASIAKVLDPMEREWWRIKGRSIAMSFSMCQERPGGPELAARIMREWFGLSGENIKGDVLLIGQYMAKRIKLGNDTAHPPQDTNNRLRVQPVLNMDGL